MWWAVHLCLLYLFPIVSSFFNLFFMWRVVNCVCFICSRTVGRFWFNLYLAGCALCLLYLSPIVSSLFNLFFIWWVVHLCLFYLFPIVSSLFNFFYMAGCAFVFALFVPDCFVVFFNLFFMWRVVNLCLFYLFPNVWSYFGFIYIWRVVHLCLFYLSSIVSSFLTCFLCGGLYDYVCWFYLVRIVWPRFLICFYLATCELAFDCFVCSLCCIVLFFPDSLTKFLRSVYLAGCGFVFLVRFLDLFLFGGLWVCVWLIYGLPIVKSSVLNCFYPVNCEFAFGCFISPASSAKYFHLFVWFVSDYLVKFLDFLLFGGLWICACVFIFVTDGLAAVSLFSLVGCAFVFVLSVPDWLVVWFNCFFFFLRVMELWLFVLIVPDCCAFASCSQRFGRLFLICLFFGGLRTGVCFM